MVTQQATPARTIFYIVAIAAFMLICQLVIMADRLAS